MNCGNCGAPNKDGAHFCESCGKPIQTDKDRNEIEHLVAYLVGRVEWTTEVALKDEATRAKIREFAETTHRRWVADKQISASFEVPAVIDGEADSVEEQFDGDDLELIFAGKMDVPSLARLLADRDEEQRRQGQEAREKAEKPDEEEASPEEIERDRERERREEKEKQEKKNVAAIVYAGIAIGTVLVFAVAFIDTKHKHGEEPTTKAERKSKKDNTASATTATPTPTVETPTNVDVPSCTCLARSDASKNTFVLQAPTPPPAGDPSRWYFDWNQRAGFTSMHSGFYATPRDAGLRGVLPPSSDTRVLRMAIGCDGDIVALVSGTTASAWAGNDSGELIWSVKLPSPLATPADAGSPGLAEGGTAPGTGLDVACTQVLTVAGGLMSVNLTNGKTVHLSMRDGTTH